MNKITITSDSGTDPINNEYLIPGQIDSSNGNNYRDVVEIEPDSIIIRKQNGEIFRTAAPLGGDYVKTFTKELEKGNDVIHLTMSSGISEGSYNGAKLIGDMLNDDYQNKVYVVDTLNGAAGGTLINEYAKYLVQEGFSTEECVKYLEEFRHRLNTAYFVPDPAGFIFSGRDKSELSIKDKIKIFGTTSLKSMGVKYRVDFDPDQGTLSFHTKHIYIGTIENQMKKFIEDYVNESNVEEYDPRYFALNTMPLKEIDKEYILNYVGNLKYFDKILDTKFNGVYTSYGCEDLFCVSTAKKLIKK